MCDQSRLEFATVAERSGRSRNIKILRKDEFKAANSYITAFFPRVGGNGHGFHAAFVFMTVRINLIQQNGQRNPFPGADFPQGHIKLQNPSERFHVQLSCIKLDCVGATVKRDIDGLGTAFRKNNGPAFDPDFRRREGDCISFGIMIHDFFVNLYGSGAGTDVLHFKAEFGAFAFCFPELINFLLNRVGIQHTCRSLSGRED